jgi:hypothetical protein
MIAVTDFAVHEPLAIGNPTLVNRLLGVWG